MLVSSIAGIEFVINLKITSEDETIIVKEVFELHKLLAQEGAIKKVLSKLKDLKPNIMVIVEQETNHITHTHTRMLERILQVYK